MPTVTMLQEQIRINDQGEQPRHLAAKHATCQQCLAEDCSYQKKLNLVWGTSPSASPSVHSIPKCQYAWALLHSAGSEGGVGSPGSVGSAGSVGNAGSSLYRP